MIKCLGSAAASVVEGELPLLDELLDCLVMILAEVPVMYVSYSFNLSDVRSHACLYVSHKMSVSVSLIHDILTTLLYWTSIL